ncbi:MAG: metallophosphoesterase family protein, partial [Eubacteriales bacterium]
MFGFLKKPKKSVKIFFATDVHGSDVVFRKFINAGKFYKVEYLILGGDIMGKFLVPIMEENGLYRTNLQGIKETMNSQEELDKVIKKIENLGFYWVIVTPERLQELQNDPAEREKIINQLATQRVEKWLDIAEEKLKGTGIKCFITGGNDDAPEVLQPLYNHVSEHVVASEAKLIEVGDGHTMIGLGYSNPTPWDTPREVSEERLEELIEECLKEVPDFSNCIFNFHVPPVDSTLDLC